MRVPVYDYKYCSIKIMDFLCGYRIQVSLTVDLCYTHFFI